MAYTRGWNESTPPDTSAANTIAQLLRFVKTDVRERLASLLGISDFTADPLKCERVDLSGVAAPKVVGGTTSLSLRDHTDANDNVLVADAGDVTVRGKFLRGAFNCDVVTDAGHQITHNSPVDIVAAQGRIARATPIAPSSSQGIDWNTGNNQALALGNSTTLTFSNGKAGAWYFLEVKQGTGPWAITWPASVKWPSGSAPTLTATNAHTDFFSFYYNGTNYAGFAVGLDYNV